MSDSRLSTLEQILTRYRKQIGSKELTLTTTPNEDKERIRLQIADIRVEMQPYEQEYWVLLSEQTESIEVSEQEAQTIVGEFVEQVDEIELKGPSYSNEVLMLLREIRDKLNQPGKSATAKLKVAVSSIPPFIGVSYEAELDTESFLSRHFPRLINLMKRTSKKKQLP